MGKHGGRKVRSYVILPHVYLARARFMDAVNMAQLTGKWNAAIACRMRGRVGSDVRAASDMLRYRVPMRWW